MSELEIVNNMSSLSVGASVGASAPPAGHTNVSQTNVSLINLLSLSTNDVKWNDNMRSLDAVVNSPLTLLNLPNNNATTKSATTNNNNDNNDNTMTSHSMTPNSNSNAALPSTILSYLHHCLSTPSRVNIYTNLDSQTLCRFPTLLSNFCLKNYVDLPDWLKEEYYQTLIPEVPTLCKALLKQKVRII